MVKISYKDIIKSNEDVIVTLVDCSGIDLDNNTKKIYKKHNISEDFYYLACKNKDYRKLLGNNLIIKTSNNYIVSMFAKCNFRTQEESVHINSLIKCLEEVKHFCLSRNFTLALCINIKVDYEDKHWLTIQEILNDIFTNIDLVLYVVGV